MKRIQPVMHQLAGATGSNYGEEWTIKLQAGLTFHSIELETNLTSFSTIEKMTLDINGTPVYYITGEQANMLDKFLGKATQQGRFVLDFTKLENETLAGKFQTQLATEITDDVTLTVKFGAKSQTDPVKPTLKGKAWVTNTDASGRVFVPRKYELVQHAAAAGTHVWEFPSGSPFLHLQRLVFKENECNITQIKVKRGDRTLSTLTRADLDFAIKRMKGYVKQTGWCVLDFTLFGFGIHGAMNTAGLKLELEVDSAGAIKTLVDAFEQKKALDRPLVG